MTAPGTWVLLSELLANFPNDRIEAETQRLMKEIVDGRWRYRYFNAEDELTYPRTQHRSERLSEIFFRSGRVKWKFSAVTFNARTIRELELFIPDAQADDAPGDREPTVDPYRSGAQPSARPPIRSGRQRRRARWRSRYAPAREPRRLS